MSTELTMRDATYVTILDWLNEAGAITPVSLDLSKEMPFETYEALGAMLGAMGRSVRWWVGDFLIFGDAMFGDKMAQAIHATGLAEATLLNYRWVCERVTKSRRRLDVPFSCHAEVAPLTPNEQKKWLAVAARESLTQRELRLRIKEAEGSGGGPSQTAPGGSGSSGLSAAASGELVKVARNLWKHAQQDTDGWYRVPGEFMARLGALIGGED